jgi:hypothetical protein
MEMNFIKVLDERTGKTVGFAVVEKGSQEEVMIVEKFLDAGFKFKPASETEFNNFGGDYVKKFENGLFCTEAPMPD